jgi:hypothetical protein
MTYIISQVEPARFKAIAKENQSVIVRFFQWASSQEKNHVGWVGLSVMLMAAVFFPLTLTAVLFNGPAFSLIIVAMISLVLVVITNLAALPTRYTIPALILGVIMDVIAIIASFILK